jgi:hypothetical protein
MSQQDLFQNEVIEELLRERAHSYILQNKKNDFWILISPKFFDDPKIKAKIEQTNFYKNKKNLILLDSQNENFYAAIISTNKEFIIWLNVRLGYFESLDNVVPNYATNSNYSDYISNGIIGKFTTVESKEKRGLFNFKLNFIHPTILLNKYKQLIEFFYQYQN